MSDQERRQYYLAKQQNDKNITHAGITAFVCVLFFILLTALHRVEQGNPPVNAFMFPASLFLFVIAYSIAINFIEWHRRPDDAESANPLTDDYDRETELPADIRQYKDFWHREKRRNDIWP